MTQVVWLCRQFKGELVQGERCLSCSAPGDAVRRGIDVVPGRITKHPPIRCYTEALYVFAQHADEDRGNGNRSCGLGGAPFQGVDLVDGTVVGPLLAGHHDPALQVQRPHPVAGRRHWDFCRWMTSAGRIAA